MKTLITLAALLLVSSAHAGPKQKTYSPFRTPPSNKSFPAAPPLDAWGHRLKIDLAPVKMRRRLPPCTPKTCRSA